MDRMLPVHLYIFQATEATFAMPSFNNRSDSWNWNRSSVKHKTIERSLDIKQRALFVTSRGACRGTKCS